MIEDSGVAEVVMPGLRHGAVVAPPSKSHAHRLLIANFLAALNQKESIRTSSPFLLPSSSDSADILATKRCLRALAEPTVVPVLDCGESGSTLRFLAPVAAALGKAPTFKRAGRLAERPFKPYPELKGGLHELAGDVSSQFVTGLLFALPLVKGDSQVRFTSRLESRGYVDMTLSVVRAAGVKIIEASGGFDIPGGQSYKPQPMQDEGDWSGAAFWLAMNALGSDVTVSGLNPDSAQPDRAIVQVLQRFCSGQGERGKTNKGMVIDVSQFPDIFPVLTVVAAAQPHETRFVGIRRLRLKECDRVAAMADVLGRFGRTVVVSDEAFVVQGSSRPFKGGSFVSYGDHRIAMSVAVGATWADGPVSIDDTACAAKSYPAFFNEFQAMPLC